MGRPPWLVGTLVTMDGVPVGEARGGCLGLLDTTVGLNVTVLCGLGATAREPAEPCDSDDISGVVSVEFDAMVGAFYSLWNYRTLNDAMPKL